MKTQCLSSIGSMHLYPLDDYWRIDLRWLIEVQRIS